MRLEDTESPDKEQNGNTHPSSPTASRKPAANGSSTHSAESNGVSSAVKTVTRPTGPFFGHNREEVTRILIQSLTDLGYHGAAGTLSRESGYELENTSVAGFRTAVLEGDWGEAEAFLFGRRRGDEDGGVGLSGNGFGGLEGDWQGNGASRVAGLPLAEGANQKEMLFLIRQQRYLELLEKRDITAALMVLRNELQPLHQDRDRLHALTNLMMCNNADKVRRDAGWDGADGESRNHLLSELSTSIAPEVMIPEHRLAVLLDHVQSAQINDCLYHNTISPPSLYHDHICDRSDFPMDLLEELRDHTDEVWHVAFSNAGDMLATASKDNSIYIYSTATWKALMRLSPSPLDGPGPDVPGVGYVAWSPDDGYLLACAQSKDLMIYDIGRNGEKLLALEHFDQPVTSAAWLPNGESFIVASHDHAHGLELYRLGDTQACHSFSNPSQRLRFSDCAITPDGSRLVAVTVDVRKCIFVFDLTVPDRPVVGEFVMEDKVNCVSVAGDGKSVLVGLEHSQLWLLDLKTGSLLQSFGGMSIENFVIRSAFGGAGDGFVVSGSEDSRVYIWKTHSGAQVECLDAHSNGPANTVAWHPTNPGIFVTGGDDKRVKVWASSNEVAKRRTSRGSRRSSGLRGLIDQTPASRR